MLLARRPGQKYTMNRSVPGDFDDAYSLYSTTNNPRIGPVIQVDGGGIDVESNSPLMNLIFVMAYE